jgi:hypothetical protein
VDAQKQVNKHLFSMWNPFEYITKWFIIINML